MFIALDYNSLFKEILNILRCPKNVTLINIAFFYFKERQGESDGSGHIKKMHI
jgi:hypothetical protein